MLILEFLFNAQLELPGSWKAEIQYGKDVEIVRQLKKKIEAGLSEEQRLLWDEYSSKGYSSTIWSAGKTSNAGLCWE